MPCVPNRGVLVHQTITSFRWGIYYMYILFTVIFRESANDIDLLLICSEETVDVLSFQFIFHAYLKITSQLFWHIHVFYINSENNRIYTLNSESQIENLPENGCYC